MGMEQRWWLHLLAKKSWVPVMPNIGKYPNVVHLRLISSIDSSISIITWHIHQSLRNGIDA
jgi:hypothetical protein